MTKKQLDYFWITNISKKAIHLGDIGVIIYPMRSINLLDTKHYNLTRAQLEKSMMNGSLFTKKNNVVVRVVPPNYDPKKIVPFKKDAIYPTKQRSAIDFENVKYEELEVSDDEYAEENAAIAETDHLGKWIK